MQRQWARLACRGWCASGPHCPPVPRKDPARDEASEATTTVRRQGASPRGGAAPSSTAARETATWGGAPTTRCQGAPRGGTHPAARRRWRRPHGGARHPARRWRRNLNTQGIAMFRAGIIADTAGDLPAPKSTFPQGVGLGPGASPAAREWVQPRRRPHQTAAPQRGRVRLQ